MKQLNLFDSLWRCKTDSGRVVYVRAESSFEALGLARDKCGLEYGNCEDIAKIEEITIDAWTEDSEV